MRAPNSKEPSVVVYMMKNLALQGLKLSINIFTYQFVEPWDLSPGHATGYHYSPGATRCGAISVENNLMQGVL